MVIGRDPRASGVMMREGVIAGAARLRPRRHRPGHRFDAGDPARHPPAGRGRGHFDRRQPQRRRVERAEVLRTRAGRICRPPKRASCSTSTTCESFASSTGASWGSCARRHDAIDRYLDELERGISTSTRCERFRVVVGLLQRHLVAHPAANERALRVRVHPDQRKDRRRHVRARAGDHARRPSACNLRR